MADVDDTVGVMAAISFSSRYEIRDTKYGAESGDLGV
jgi:hypothetical protein